MSCRDLLRAAVGMLGAGLFVAAISLLSTPLIGAEPRPLLAPPAVIGPDDPTESENDYWPGPLASVEVGPQLTPTPLSATPLDPAPPPSEPAQLKSPAHGLTPPTPLPTTTWMGAPCGVRYWIVSSRCNPQGFPEGGSLQVYECGCDGCLRPSNCPSMVGQFLPGAPVMLFMHGAYVDWEANLEQSAATYEWIRCACQGRPINIVFYTWQSDQQRVLLAPCELRHLGAAAEANAFNVAALLGCIPSCHPVCLLGHSFGARMALATAHLAAGGDLDGRCLSRPIGYRRMRIVIAAAAVDHHWLNDCQRYALATCYAEGILNLYNRHDCALKFYPLLRLFSRRALGTIGQTRIDQHRQACPGKVHNCEVTGLVGHGHFWPNYYRSGELARIVAPWVYFPDAVGNHPPGMYSTASGSDGSHGSEALASLDRNNQPATTMPPETADGESSPRFRLGNLGRSLPTSVAPRNRPLSTAAREESPYRPLRNWLSTR